MFYFKSNFLMTVIISNKSFLSTQTVRPSIKFTAKRIYIPIINVKPQNEESIEEMTFISKYN
jgi:hypothetical protein